MVLQTRRVPLVEHALLPILEHLSSLPVFHGAQSLVCCEVLWRPYFVGRCVLLSAIFSITAFEYPFGIWKLFLMLEVKTTTKHTYI